jgi:hypothetical protein
MSRDCPSKVTYPRRPGGRKQGLVGPRSGHGSYCGHPGRAPLGRGDRSASAHCRGGGAREYLGDASAANGGVAMLPRPSVPKHSPRESSKAEPRPALPVGVAYVLGKEAFLSGTFRPQPLGIPHDEGAAPPKVRCNPSGVVQRMGHAFHHDLKLPQSCADTHGSPGPRRAKDRGLP